MRRGSLGFLLGAFALVGCGLSLSVDPVAITGPDPLLDASIDTGVPPQPTADVNVSETPPAPGDYDVREERIVAIAGVVALAFDPASALVALVYEPATTTVSAIDVATTGILFSSAEATAPSSLVALGKRSALPIGLYAISADRGLFAFVENETVSRAYGARTDASRVHGRDGHVFVASAAGATTVGGTKIVACGARFPDTETECDAPTLVYDGQELGGFAVSPNDLLLAGITGAGDAARIVVFSRTDTTSTFATPVPISLTSGIAGKVEEIVDVSDDGLRIRVRGPCRTTNNPLCLQTIAP